MPEVMEYSGIDLVYQGESVLVVATKWGVTELKNSGVFSVFLLIPYGI